MTYAAAAAAARQTLYPLFVRFNPVRQKVKGFTYLVEAIEKRVSSLTAFRGYASRRNEWSGRMYELDGSLKLI